MSEAMTNGRGAATGAKNAVAAMAIGPQPWDFGVPEAVAVLARFEIRVRASRARFFKSSLSSDSAWDILLELFVAEQEGRRVPISSVGLTTGIPATTALRWINVLRQHRLVERVDDPLDGRRSFLSLSEDGLQAMTHYFQNSRKMLRDIYSVVAAEDAAAGPESH